MRWKGFFYFTRTERRGILLLLVLIGVVGVVAHWMPTRKTTSLSDEAFEQEYLAFKASIQQQKQAREKHRSTKRPQQRPVVLRPFDPNNSDSIVFLELGLSPRTAGNILRYRAKGGEFREPEDFRKVYGLTEEQYTTLLPYLSITEPPPAKQDRPPLYTKRVARDSLLPSKFPEGTVVDLNRADTAELKRIPNIGSALARMIVGYRKRLGGFVNLDQLAEINLSVEKVRPWFVVNAQEIEQINLNRVSVERLKQHPYFNFYQAKVIVEHRKKRGKLTSLQQLKLYEEFTPDDLKRVAPYVCFE